MSDDSKVLGVLVLARHGDRQGFYQNPSDYTPTNTQITPLGNVQEFRLGQYLRERYFNSLSPTFISGVNSTIANLNQVKVRADAGGEGGVIANSAMSLLQGLFPANANYTTTLANGTTIEGPLNGYQYLPIESVEPDNDISLEGWTKCGTFDQATKAFYQSAEFKQKADESASFLSQLPRYLDGRPVSLENMWNIFDFINVENIHDSDFHNNIPATFVAQARDLANWHEYGVFSDKELSGIGNIPFRTMIPSVVESLQSIADESDPLKFVHVAISYKPFISLFNMTGVAQAHPELAGIVNYAASVALEVRQPSSGGDPVLRFNFKNGTDDVTYKTYSFFNASGDVPLSTFVNYLNPAAINTTAQWCTECNNSKDRGCGALALAASQAQGQAHRQRISPVGAGFLGAGLTLFVAAAMLAVLFFLGLLTFGKKGRKAQSVHSDDHSVEKAA
uniref:Phosphoglycerate mutase-like protein n=1 Tax=Moniliophthora roreri TaxID=221103 RepID=A0A0W0G0D6_MONRR